MCVRIGRNKRNAHMRYVQCKLQSTPPIKDHLVEGHCYSIGRTGQLLSNRVAVETDGNVKRFDREGLCQLQCYNVTL